MTPQLAPVENKKPAPAKPLWRPDESFWQRYSPHHEFPLATVSAITLCGLAVAFLFLLWILAFGVDNEADGPVRVDAIDMPGPEGGGPGLDGLGTGTKNLAAGAKTEIGAATPSSQPSRPSFKAPAVQLADDLKVNPLALSPPDDTATPADAAALTSLQKDIQQAETEFKIALERAAARKAGGTGPKGGTGGLRGNGNGPGSGGGVGTGIGTKSGPGTGRRAATRQQILAWRWRFDLSGEGAEHANKLVAVGVTLAVLSPAGKYFLIRDLKKRPVDLVPADLSRHQDEVKWYNTQPTSLRNLAATLGIPFQPRHVVMLLPKEREEKMAALEQQEMQRRGLATVHATWFDFRPQNGVYEPFVTRIE